MNIVVDVDAFIADLERAGVDRASRFLVSQALRRHEGERVTVRRRKVREEAAQLVALLAEGMTKAEAIRALIERAGVSRASAYRRLEMISTTERNAA